MGKNSDMYYSKLFDALEIIHAENIAIAQGIIRLAKDGTNNQEIEKLCAELDNKWDEAFRDIRKW